MNADAKSATLDLRLWSEGCGFAVERILNQLNAGNRCADRPFRRSCAIASWMPCFLRREMVADQDGLPRDGIAWLDGHGGVFADSPGRQPYGDG